jgi:hypothetical protein
MIPILNFMERKKIGPSAHFCAMSENVLCTEKLINDAGPFLGNHT